MGWTIFLVAAKYAAIFGAGAWFGMAVMAILAVGKADDIRMERE